MATLDVVPCGPNLLHLPYIAALESAIKAFVSLSDFLFFPIHASLMVRLRGHKDQRHKPLLAPIPDSMTLSRRRQHDLPGAEFPLFVADLEQTFAFQHVINFVLAAVGVRALLLAGLEAVGVTEKSVGLKNPVLFHLLGGELPGVRKLLEVAHARLLLNQY